MMMRRERKAKTNTFNRMRRARKANTNTFNRMIKMMWRGLDVRTNSGNDLVDTKIRSADGRKDQWNGKTIDESRVRLLYN